MLALLGAVIGGLLAMPATASAASSDIAALQVAMTGVGLYPHPVDGISGPWTQGAVRTFQSQHGLAADGIAGAKTRAALGKRGKPNLGGRPMREGKRGWDVAALQFLLHTRGFEPGGFDGGFGPNTVSAVRRYQAAAGLQVDGVAGPSTLNALQGGQVVTAVSPSSPVRFFRPVPGAVGDGFGWIPPGRLHTGLDFPEPMGTPIHAGGVGVVSFAGFNTGGYGNLVVITHRLGFESWYAHQSRIAVSVGQSVVGGQTIGYVGSTGHSTGPHLHFEVRHFGTPVDPTPYLLGYRSAGNGRHARASRRRRKCRPNADARGRGADPLTARLDRCP
jgi:peptidoglycan hydrolase-like protein with peptidoglycan-binding domain